MISVPSWLRSRWFRIPLELALAAAVFVGGYRVAHRHLAIVDAPTFISWELKPAVMLACGYGFMEPGAPTPAVERFITRRSGSVTCQDFAWGGAPSAPQSIAAASRYSLYGAAWAMRLNGISWETLDGYLAFLYGISMAFVYGLFRMAAGRVLAIVGVIAVACSPGVIEIVALRDFVKLPCFTALWLVLAWVVRAGLRHGPKATILPMAAGGALLGLGIGLRMDALVFVPVFIAIALIAVPGFSWRALGLKAAAAVVFVALFFITGRPILTAISGGSNSAHVVVLGMMTPFDAGLAIDPAPYDIGTQYADGFAYAVIVSHGLYAHGEKLPVLLGSAEYDRIGGRMIRGLAATFPADVVTRALGATWQIFRFPFDWRIHETAGQIPVFQESPLITRLMEWRSSALGLFSEREVPITLLVLALAAAFNWRLGVLGLAVILYFCGYSMLQFSRRHIFHLDVIPIFVALLAVQLPLLLAWRIGVRFWESRAAGLAAARSYARELAIGAGVLAAALGLLLAVLAGLRWWQQRQVVSLVDTTLAANWVPTPISEEPLADSILVDGRPTAAWYDLYRANPGLWKTATLMRLDGVVPRGTEMAGDGDLQLQYFKVTVDGGCDADEVLIGVQYTGSSQTFDYLFTRAFKVPVERGRPSYVMTPAYYGLGSTWTRFDGFGVPASQRACVTGIERAAQPAALPNPVLALALGPDWRSGRLHQELLDRPRVSAAGSAVDPLPDDEETHRSGWRRNTARALALPVPPLDAWDVGEGVTLTQQGGLFRVRGNSVVSGYQLVSPPLDVPARHVVAFQIVGEISRGEMCVGLLDGAQQRWLLAPTDARVGLLADTEDLQQVRLVFSNCAHPPGEFTVRSITYEAFPAK